MPHLPRWNRTEQNPLPDMDLYPGRRESSARQVCRNCSRDHIDYIILRYRSQIRRACDNQDVQMLYDIVQERTHGYAPSVRQYRMAIIISTTVISCCLKGPEWTATRRQSVTAPCSVLPSLIVPRLVSPFTNIVTAAVACLDTCVRAGEQHQDGRRPAGSRKSRIKRAAQATHSAVKTTANRKLND